MAEATKEPHFRDIAHLGWPLFLRRRLESLGCPRSEVDDLVSEHATEVDLRLQETLQRLLENILNDFEGVVTATPKVYEGEPF